MSKYTFHVFMNDVANTSDCVTDCSSQESTGSKRKSRGRNGNGSRARKRPRQQSYKIADVIDTDVSIKGSRCLTLINCGYFLVPF